MNRCRTIFWLNVGVPKKVMLNHFHFRNEAEVRCRRGSPGPREPARRRRRRTGLAVPLRPLPVRRQLPLQVPPQLERRIPEGGVGGRGEECRNHLLLLLLQNSCFSLHSLVGSLKLFWFLTQWDNWQTNSDDCRRRTRTRALQTQSVWDTFCSSATLTPKDVGIATICGPITHVAQYLWGVSKQFFQSVLQKYPIYRWMSRNVGKYSHFHSVTLFWKQGLYYSSSFFVPFFGSFYPGTLVFCCFFLNAPAQILHRTRQRVGFCLQYSLKKKGIRRVLISVYIFLTMSNLLHKQRTRGFIHTDIVRRFVEPLR